MGESMPPPSNFSFGGCSAQGHLGPWGSDSEDSHPSKRGPGPKLLLVCDCTRYSLHWSVPSVGTGSHAHRAFPPGFQQVAFVRVRGQDRPIVHSGFCSRDSSHEGIFHFPARPLPGISPLPRTVCCPQSVPSLCLVGLMFQTRSLTVSSLSHRCL